uniref:Uncharacterized protein n=1 Tax=Zea mays TaxID=4577 RepID=C4J803_MAIZE|nr:unknown [Zea mays]
MASRGFRAPSLVTGVPSSAKLLASSLRSLAHFSLSLVGWNWDATPASHMTRPLRPSIPPPPPTRPSPARREGSVSLGRSKTPNSGRNATKTMTTKKKAVAPTIHWR